MATKPQRKLFLEGHLPRRSRRSNRTENTEPRTDNGWSWTTRPPGSLSSSPLSCLFLSLTLLSRGSRNNNGPRTQHGHSGDPLSIVVFSTLSRSITATFDHFLTSRNPERKGGRWSQGLNRGIERRIAWKIVIKRETLKPRSLRFDGIQIFGSMIRGYGRDWGFSMAFNLVIF